MFWGEIFVGIWKCRLVLWPGKRVIILYFRSSLLLCGFCGVDKICVDDKGRIDFNPCSSFFCDESCLFTEIIHIMDISRSFFHKKWPPCCGTKPARPLTQSMIQNLSAFSFIQTVEFFWSCWNKSRSVYSSEIMIRNRLICRLINHTRTVIMGTS